MNNTCQEQIIAIHKRLMNPVSGGGHYHSGSGQLSANRPVPRLIGRFGYEATAIE